MIIKMPNSVLMGYFVVGLASILQIYLNAFVIKNLNQSFVIFFLLISQVASFALYFDFGLSKLTYLKHRNKEDVIHVNKLLDSAIFSFWILSFLSLILALLFLRLKLLTLWACAIYSILLAIAKSKSDALGNYHSAILVKFYFLIFNLLIVLYIYRINLPVDKSIKVYSMIMLLGYLFLIYRLVKKGGLQLTNIKRFHKKVYELKESLETLGPVFIFTLVSGLVVFLDKFIVFNFYSNDNKVFYLGVSDFYQKTGIVTSIATLWVSQKIKYLGVKFFLKIFLLFLFIFLILYYFQNDFICLLGFRSSDLNPQTRVIYLSITLVTFVAAITSPFSIALSEYLVFNLQLKYYLIELLFIFIGALIAIYFSSLALLSLVVLIRTMFNFCWTLFLYIRTVN